MLVLLSPAKTMEWRPIPPGLTGLLPQFLEEAAMLIDAARGLSVAQLCSLMALSPALGELAWRRFRDFSPPFTPDNSRPAALLYRGDTYTGLDADTLTPADWQFAAERLRILSGLYGLLRPLDLIQPYRLEMATALANPRGRNLYAFWGETLTRQVDELAGHQGAVVNLASEEYSRAVGFSRLHHPTITPVFQEIRQGKPRVIGLLAKRARGQMARFILRHRLENVEALRAFQEGGYTHDPAASTPERWIFCRAVQGL